MKVLTAIAALQTVGILVLIGLAVRAPPADALRESNTLTQPLPTNDALDEARLRSIIQQEFARHAAAEPGSSPPMATRDFTSDRAQRDAVERQLAYLLSIGTYTPEALDTFHMETLKLPPAERREALSRLARLINSGQLREHH